MALMVRAQRLIGKLNQEEVRRTRTMDGVEYLNLIHPSGVITRAARKYLQEGGGE